MMEKNYSKQLLFSLILLIASIQYSFSQILISQVYGGGGNSGSKYKNDFVELINVGASDVSLNGWSVQYASSSSTSFTVFAFSDINIKAGHYLLVQLAAGTGGTTDLPTADEVGSINLAATAGQIALCNSITALNSGDFDLGSPTGSSIVDFVGYGSSTINYKGTAPVSNLSNTNAAIRLEDGKTNTNNNQADFSVAAPTPRNSSSVVTASNGMIQNNERIKVFSNKVEIICSNVELLELYSVNGQKIKDYELQPNLNVIEFENSGMYLIKLENSVQKVVIRK